MNTVVGGAYELLTLAGSGGMGAVWRARQLSLGRTVAVKLLLTDSGDDEPRRAAAGRLRDEARAAARVAHPDLVSVLDTGDDPALGPFIVYELLEGGSLRDRLDRGELGWAVALEEVGRPLLDGLAALHEAGMVHRDVKPENIIAGADGRFRLGDFGLALFEGRQARTAEGAFVGTPGYLAPERIIGGTVGAAADVYAAAVVLVEAATGRLPFRGGSVADMVREQAVRSPSPSALAGLGLPDHAAAVLASALIREPGGRPGAAELLGRLAAPPTPAVTEVLRRPTMRTAPLPATRVRRRSPVLPLTMVLVVLAVAAALRLGSEAVPAAAPDPVPQGSALQDDPALRRRLDDWFRQYEAHRRSLREERLRLSGLALADTGGQHEVRAYVARGDELLERIEGLRPGPAWSPIFRVVCGLHAACVARFDSHVDMSMPDLHRKLRPSGTAFRATACSRAERLLASVAEDFRRETVAFGDEISVGFFLAVERLLAAAATLPERDAAVAEARQVIEKALGGLAPILRLVDLDLEAGQGEGGRARLATLVPGMVRTVRRSLMEGSLSSSQVCGADLGVLRGLVTFLGAAVRDGAHSSLLEAVVAESLGTVDALERRDGPSPQLDEARLARLLVLCELALEAADKTARAWRSEDSVPAPGRREVMVARVMSSLGDLIPALETLLEGSGLPEVRREALAAQLAATRERRSGLLRLLPELGDPTVMPGGSLIGDAERARESLRRLESGARGFQRSGDRVDAVDEVDRLVLFTLYRRSFWTLFGFCSTARDCLAEVHELTRMTGDIMQFSDFLRREDGSLFGLEKRLVATLCISPTLRALRGFRRMRQPEPRRELGLLRAGSKLINRLGAVGLSDLLEGWESRLADLSDGSSSLMVLRALHASETREPEAMAGVLDDAGEAVLGRAEGASAPTPIEAELSLEELGHLLDLWATLGARRPGGADAALAALVARCEALVSRWRTVATVGPALVERLAALADLYRIGLERRRSTSAPPALSPESIIRLKQIVGQPEFGELEGRCVRLLNGEDVVRLRQGEHLGPERLGR